MNEVSQSNLRELLDRQKCYGVLTRYCRGLDRCDVDLLKSCYWPDGIDEHSVYEGNAVGFCEWIVDQIQNWFDAATHMICNVHMEYYGDVMCAESYLLGYSKVGNNTDQVEEVFGAGYLSKLESSKRKSAHHVFLFGGRYIDRLEKRDGEWRIALRRVCMDWNENWPGNAIFDEGIFPAFTTQGCRSKKDPVYENVPVSGS